MVGKKIPCYQILTLNIILKAFTDKFALPSQLKIYLFKVIVRVFIIVLKIQMSKNPPSQTVKFFIRLDNGNGCSLNIAKNQTLDQLVDAINQQQLELPHTYRILFKGKHIKDYTQTIEDIAITENSILHIEEVGQRSGRTIRMDVCIFWSGEKFIVKCSSSQKIVNLKQSIYKLIKINPKDQLLVFKGFILQNQHTLAHYRIKPDSLICLHTTVKITDIDDNNSDYEQITEGFALKQNQLLESVVSLGQLKKGTSKTTLFRSDSMGMKGLQQMQAYQIQIHHRANNNNDDQSEQQKEFNFDLFKSFGMANPMTLSIGYNLFDSFKYPIDRFTFKTFEIKHEDGKEKGYGEVLEENSLAKSISSFEDI